MKIGIRFLAAKRVFSSVTWGLVAISAALVPFHARVSDRTSEMLFNTGFLLMLVVAFLTQCVPPGVKRNIAPAIAAAVMVVAHELASR